MPVNLPFRQKTPVEVCHGGRADGPVERGGSSGFLSDKRSKKEEKKKTIGGRGKGGGSSLTRNEKKE